MPVDYKMNATVYLVVLDALGDFWEKAVRNDRNPWAWILEATGTAPPA